MRIVKRILCEPLLHFLLLGALLFLLYGIVEKREVEQGKIVVTQGKIEQLASTFTRTWQRSPTQEELEGLIRDYVREEVYCRQALALGLDREDIVIRRRLRQKMEFLTDDVAAQMEPTDAQLNAYLKQHSGAFRTERSFSFKQVYLNPEKHGKQLAQDAAQLLTKLNQSKDQTDLASMGDSFLLDSRFESATESQISKQFGEQFVAKLSELTPGKWEGPIESGYGAHLVLISERTEGRLPPLNEVRDQVRREWANEQRLEANEKFYQSLLKNYVVEIEPTPQEKQEKMARMGER